MRTSGILLPITSVPSPYGIGTFGAKAYEFVDFLAKSKQHYWQILPIGPTSYGDSPYQSFSAFAINYYFIDIDFLLKDGLLTKKEIASFNFGEDKSTVDYETIYNNRKPLLKLAAKRFDITSKDFIRYKKQNSFWLKDFALYMAIKSNRKMVSYSEWEPNLIMREKKALKSAEEEYAKEVLFWEIMQYLAYTQWKKLKKYANSKNVSIIGDIPIYVSPDSSDIWANPELFQVDENMKLTEVAGCPPDAFSADGQLWGNPLYDWDYHFAQEFSWWKKRIKQAADLFDCVRIDHFRGFAGYYAIPFGDKTAVNGRWRVGPGLSIILALKSAFPKFDIIAEDLGYLTEDVHELLRQSGFPGMKVLQFAFDASGTSTYLPHNHVQNTVVYTGTHDNTTTEDWLVTSPKKDIKFFREYLNVSKDQSLTHAMIVSAFSSVADTCIVPMADWLKLGASARINTPSTLGDNWVWRLDDTMLTKSLSKEIAKLTKMYWRA